MFCGFHKLTPKEGLEARGGIGETLEQIQIFRRFNKFVAEPVKMLFDGKGQRVFSIMALIRLRLGEQLCPLGVGMAVFKLFSQFGVDDKFRRRRERIERRHMDIIEKTSERRVTVGEQPVGVVDVVARGGKNLIEHLVLFVTEKIFQRIVRLAKMPVHHADRFRKIRAFKGGFCSCSVHHNFPDIGKANAAIQIMPAHVEHAISQNVRSSVTDESNFNPADGEPRISRRSKAAGLPA